MSFVKYENQQNPTTNSTVETKTVEKNSIIDATVGIHWKGLDTQHSDWIFIPNINLSRDYLPELLETKLQGLSAGSVVKHTFQPGELLKDYEKSSLVKIRTIDFQPLQNEKKNQPRVGRFYPKDFLSGVDDFYQGNQFYRVNSIKDDEIIIDLNHPLAGKTIEMEFQINSIHDVAFEQSGHSKNVLTTLYNMGPGMQDQLTGKPTEFFYHEAFKRMDENDDSIFFAIPDFEPFWDSIALRQVAQLYQRLIPDNCNVLDLMAGAHSPLQDSTIDTPSVYCAGLNLKELQHNPICTECHSLNVNSISTLPYDDQQMDVVLIHAAIEYVTQPNVLMTEIARVLKPGGRIIITFSNRSVEEKAIQLWKELLEFERPALVQRYLAETDSFTNFQSYSMHGLFKPDEDKLCSELLYSDPVYAVWADRIRDS